MFRKILVSSWILALAFGLGQPAAARDEAVGSLDRLVVYLDPALVNRRAQFWTAETLADDAGELAALGHVEVVEVDGGEARRVLDPTRDARQIRGVLQELTYSASDRGDATALREAFLADAPDRVAAGCVREAARREVAFVTGRLEILRRWIETQPPASGAATFLWITGGFDVRPAEFYARAAGKPLVGEPGLRAEVDRVVRRLADAGWTVTPLTLHDGPIGFPRRGTMGGFQPERRGLWTDPLQPLRIAAVHTGGVVISDPDALRRLLRPSIPH